MLGTVYNWCQSQICTLDSSLNTTAWPCHGGQNLTMVGMIVIPDTDALLHNNINVAT